MTIHPIAPALFSKAIYVQGEVLSRSNPGDVTDLQLKHLACYLTPAALADVVQRRAAAIQRRADDAFQEAQARTAVVPHTAAAAPPPAEPLPGADASVEELLAWVVRTHPTWPTSIALFAKLHAFTMARHTKMLALEQRVLELEAQAAARAPVVA